MGCLSGYSAIILQFFSFQSGSYEGPTLLADFEADLPREEKSRLLEAVRDLPGESIKHLTTRLLDAGLENLPRAVELIRSVLPVS